jgi:pimeloyl-ACP methyl ester carboxylesterase
MKLKRLLFANFFLVPIWLFPFSTSAQANSQFFNSNGVKIRYILVGQGEPVILIHGFASNAEMWRTLSAELSQDHQVIALDCRGHGKSDKPHAPEQYGIEMVNDVVRLMDHLHISKAHIIGYSMGGAIATKMLIEHPDRFITAVIGGSAGYRAGDPDRDAPLVKYLQSGMSFSEAMIAAIPPGTPPPSTEQREAMKRMDSTQDPKALAAQRLGNKGLTVDYKSFTANKVPTLVIYGGNDNPEKFTDLKKVLAKGEFKIIAGAGHGGAVQSPEFLENIKQFLKSHKPTKTAKLDYLPNGLSYVR